jgi:hypothetical protein
MTAVLTYPIKFNSDLSDIPKDFKKLLDFAYKEKYDELYEENAGNVLLEDICLKIVSQLKDKDKLLTYQRYLFMALIMSDAVNPTVKIYLPKDNRTQKIFQIIDSQLMNKRLISSKKNIESILKNLFPEISIGIQEVDEAFDVFKNLLKMLEPLQSQNALLEILDDCFQGYAVFPCSENRRDLFNWWLLDVVPAVWKLEDPKKIYTINGFQNYADI